MSPRKRTIDDDVVIQAAWQTVLNRGVHHLRIADVAAASGLAPATLIQRFGTREALLDAVAQKLLDDLHVAFRHGLTPALETLPLADHLVFFLGHQVKAPEYANAFRKLVGLCLAAMVENGELPPHDVAYMATQMQAHLFGCAMSHVLTFPRSPVRENLAQQVPHIFAAFETGGA